MKKKLLTLLKFFLIVLYINYYGSTIFFVHTHQTPYGPITHSHPYKGAHQHSANAFVTIAVLSEIAVCTVLFAAAVFIQRVVGLVQTSYHKYHAYRLLQHVYLRAPPYC